MKSKHILHKVFDSRLKNINLDGAANINPIACDLKNPADAALYSEKGTEFKLVSTDLRGDYLGQYLRVAVRQRYLNHGDKTQKIRYRFHLGDCDSLLDFQTVVGNKITRYSDLKIKGPSDDGLYMVTLGYLRPGEEINVVYVYSRLTASDSDDKVTFRIKASEKETDPESFESVGFFLRGGVSSATACSPSVPIFTDPINHGNTYVCPNDVTVLNAVLCRFAELNKERLDSGEMGHEDLLDLCPAKINPVFDRDFILTLENFEIQADELSRIRFDVRGEVIDAALTGGDDYSKEFIRVYFLNAPTSPILLPLIEGTYVKKSPAKDKLYNMTESEVAELLELFETTVLTNLDAGGLSGPLTLNDILSILLPIVPPKFRTLLWNMSFDPMYMTLIETRLWALLFTELIESEERNAYAYKNLLTLAKDALRGVPKRIRNKLMERLSQSYENGFPQTPGSMVTRSLS
jgi:hypothetical protein